MKAEDVKVGMQVDYQGDCYEVIYDMRKHPAYPTASRSEFILLDGNGYLKVVYAKYFEPHVPTETWKVKEITWEEYLQSSEPVVTGWFGGRIKCHKLVD